MCIAFIKGVQQANKDKKQKQHPVSQEEYENIGDSSIEQSSSSEASYTHKTYQMGSKVAK